MDNQNNMFPIDEDTDICVTLDLDDGTQLECEILTIFEVEGRDYIVLVPAEEDDEDSEENTVYIYRYMEDEDGNPSLENILDDKELKLVEDQFNELLEEYDEDDE